MSSTTLLAEPLRLGSLVLQPVSDGVLAVEARRLFPEAPAAVWPPQAELDAEGRIALALTCLVVHAGERRILVDTGFGARAENPAVGKLPEALARHGLRPTDIDTVVISHPHADHVGGATQRTGAQVRPTYPQARYWISRADWEHFTQPQLLQERGLADTLPPLAQAQQLELADGEQEVAPGVRLLPLPGHTPGHMGVVFASGQQLAFYVGDLIHHPLQIEHPDWTPVFDALPPMSRQSREQLVERARRDRALVLSYHLPWPGIGRINGGWQAAT